jgi:maleate cis-trans isomerase
MFGWRGRIGYIATETGERGTIELIKLLPEGVGLNIATLPKNVNNVDEAVLEGAITQLVHRGVDCIIFACTPRVVNEEYGTEDELIKRLGKISGKIVTTTTRAATEALKALSIKKVLLTTSFDELDTMNIKKYLEKNGFQVPFAKYLENCDVLKKALGVAYGMPEEDYEHNNWITFLPEDFFFHQGKRAFHTHPDVDGIYAPCVQWVTNEMLVLLEKEIKKPVVASTVTSVWWAMKALHINEPITGHGMLLETL